MARIYCYRCNQVQSGSTSKNPRCRMCGSQAVQYVRQKATNTQNKRQQTIRSNLGNRLIIRQPFMNSRSPFDLIGQNSIFRDHQMQNMFFGTSLFKKNQRRPNLPFFQNSRNFNDQRPFFYNQRILETPQRVIIVTRNNADQQQLQIYENQLINNTRIQQVSKPKLEDLPNIPNLVEQCTICNTKDSKGVVLPCGHQFHNDCLKPWLQIKDNCPCCRMKINI